MIKLVKTYESLVAVEDVGYTAVRSALEAFIKDNCHIIGVEVLVPFDGQKSSIRLYSHTWQMDDVETIDVDVLENIDIDEIWDMMNGNIRSMFRGALAYKGYMTSLNPEKDAEQHCKLYIEKSAIKKHLISKSLPMTQSYIEGLFYRNSAVSYYTSRSSMSVNFMQIGEGLEKNEFDVIRVSMPITAHLKTRDEVIKIITKQKKEFDAAVVAKISNTPKFKNSGFTMNYFECSSVVLTRSMILVYTFDIKKDIRKLFEK